MMEKNIKWNRDTFENVRLPEATEGHCRNYIKCQQFNVQLANGYCVECWDKGLDTAKARMETKARDANKRPKIMHHNNDYCHRNNQHRDTAYLFN